MPERYQSVIDGRSGPLQDAEVEIEKVTLNAMSGAESSNSHINVRLASGGI